MRKRWFFILYLIMLGACHRGHDKDAVLATVNGTSIRRSDLDKNVALVMGMKSIHAVPKAVYRKVFEDLIDKRLILEKIGVQPIRITEDDVKHAVFEMHEGWVSDDYDKELRDLGMTGIDIDAMIREQVQIEKYLREEVLSRIALGDERTIAERSQKTLKAFLKDLRGKADLQIHEDEFEKLY
jgi:hypothetical protein